MTIGIAALLVTAGCSNKSLQKLDGSGGGIGVIDANGPVGGEGGVADGGAAPDGGAIDRPRDVSFTGRRFFNVSANVFDALSANVTSHGFTLMLDAEQRQALVGGQGGGSFKTFEGTATGAIRFTSALQFGVPVEALCGGSVQYDDLVLTIDAAGGLSGGGTGTLTTYAGDETAIAAVTMTLAGVPDSEPPTLTLSAGGEAVDPWTSLWIVASEPLPGQQVWPALRSTSGDVVRFESLATTSFATVLETPRRLLRFGDEYRITFQGITDFAGNELRPSTPAPFTTRPPPPVIAPDGFESLADAAVGGAEVLSGAGAPTIAGARSLYIPPADSLGPSGRQTQLAVRLALPPGHTTLRFDYRTVNPADSSGVYFLVASAGGTMETASLASDVAAVTEPAMVGSTQVRLGPKTTAVIGIPGDARGEIVVARIASQGAPCGGPPPPPVPGLIIDDLRTE